MSKLIDLAMEYSLLNLPEDPGLKKIAIQQYLEETNDYTEPQNAILERGPVNSKGLTAKAS